MKKPDLYGAMSPPPEPVEWRVPKTLDVGMTVAITRTVLRPWWAFWRRTRVTEFHQITARRGQTFYFNTGDSLTLPSKIYPRHSPPPPCDWYGVKDV